jgi:thiol-disulfide isomerase/thioredoxin
MKITILSICCLLILTANSQETTNKKFILNGTVHDRDTGYVILAYSTGLNKLVRDSAYLQKGKFKFEGETSAPFSAILNVAAVNSVQIFIEPTVQEIELTGNNYDHAKMTGSYTQKEWEALKMRYDSIDTKYSSIDQKELDGKNDERLYADISFILTHPNSYLSAWLLYTPANVLDIDSAKALFTTLSPRIQNSSGGKYIADYLRKKEQNIIGKTPYNFTVQDITGNNISLSDFRNKYVYIDFWASWCVPCIAQIPHLKELYEKYRTKGFEIITISIDADSIAWKKAVVRHQLQNWHHILANEEIEKNYPNVRNPIPSGILISPDGKIIWKSMGGGNEEELGEILKRVIK